MATRLIDTNNPTPEQIKQHEENLKRIAERARINEVAMRQGRVVVPITDKFRFHPKSNGAKKP